MRGVGCGARGVAREAEGKGPRAEGAGGCCQPPACQPAVQQSWRMLVAELSGSGTADERANYELIGEGEGIHWPALDEDISVEGLLAGRRSAESAASLAKWMEERKQR